MKRRTLIDRLPWALVVALAIATALTLNGCTGCQTHTPAIDVTDTGDTQDGADGDTDDGDTPDGAPDGTPDGRPDSDDLPPIDVDPPNVCIPAGEGPSFQVSARADLRWKRVHALKNDLLTAMELTEAEACEELGLALPGICFNIVHQVPLGGNDPVAAAMYRPIMEPTITTALAIDRVTTAACGKRVDEDTLAQQAGELGNVFHHMDLTAEAIEVGTPGLQAQIDELYRRFLARSPTDAEMQIVLPLAAPLDGTPVSARDFAKAACFTIATTTEFAFH